MDTELEQLRRNVAAAFKSAPLLDLIAALVDPGHRYADAIALLRAFTVVEQDPWAEVWLAFCEVHHLMNKEALTDAGRRLEAVISLEPNDAYSAAAIAAACVLLPEVQDDLGIGDLKERIRFLERSIALAPTWSTNFRRLARAYERVGRHDAAIGTMETAVRNLRRNSAGEPEPSIADLAVEICWTGRGESSEVLKRELVLLRGTDSSREQDSDSGA